MLRITLLCCASITLAACAGRDDRGGGGSGDPPLIDPAADAGTPPPPPPPPGDAGEVPGCDSVDLLFVVDDSSSMSDNQESLAASFPAFAAGIRERLARAPSVHVGVVTTDDYQHNAGGCRNIGDLVTQTGGPESSNAVCGPFASGGRYLDEHEPDLGSAFSCAAKVGSTGADDERVARALLNAIDPERNAAGACNAGFSRPDSLLVIVIITDEDDVPDVCDPSLGTCQTYGSGGEPADWYAELAGYKDPSRVVVLSLLGRRGDNPCGAQPASTLMRFTNMFDENGHLGDVCAASYDDFFRDALPVIHEACVNLI